MNNIVPIPQTKFLNEDWTESDGTDHFKKTFFHSKAISLKPEFDFYLKKFGRVYSVCKSRSGKSFILRVNDGIFYWEDGGYFVRRLSGHTLEDAINDAIKKMPDEAAFLCVNTVDYVSGDPDFDNWFKSLNIFKDDPPDK